MTRSTTGNRFRTRKLSTKQALAILRESQIDSIDDDGQRYIPQIDTGVNQQEEIEHHLQAAISASQAAVVGGQVAQIFIPTPDASKTVTQYDALYPKKFSQPTSYIRFSSTVEDACGTAYCMDSDDDKFLQKLNSTKRSTGAQCSEDTFEECMQHFESLIAVKQPYLSMDVSQILPHEDFESAFDESHSAAVRSWAKLIYPHWKERRIARGGKSIMPAIRIESGPDKDDDPYVCFRKFEIRQVRKTRRTDAQSTEKLKKLRQEMEMARAIVADVLAREKMRKESIAATQGIFELRAAVKDFKRKHNLRGDDEDLYDNSKSRKPNVPVPPAPARTGTQPVLRAGTEMRPPEAELQQLSEAQRKKVDKWRGAVEAGQQKRLYANMGIEDFTEMPISNLEIPKPQDDYRGVQTYYLPSPPPSASPVSSPVAHPIDDLPKIVTVRSEQATYGRNKHLPSYRRRYGRGGRLMIDRKYLPVESPKEIDPIVADRFKYDRGDDEFEYEYQVDPFSTLALQLRARLLSPPADVLSAQYAMRRQTIEQLAAAQGQQMVQLPPTAAGAAAATTATPTRS
ncbi:enhancer of polycomb-like-domain-containing protein [Kalaharituber pfeilii]|nr:enhancer of polycomb-like-domain-containing protein [Kalaharituber pfeilii]